MTQNVVLGIVAADVLPGAGLGVLRVVCLHQPVVPLGGVGADVVQVVVEAELLLQRMLVGCDSLAELRQRRVAVTSGVVAVDLVVGAVLLDDHEDVLDRGRVPETLWDGDRICLGSGCLLDAVRAPGVLGEDRRGVLADLLVVGQREAGQ